jgi:KDO2-lipid IV(A) lauroyltransferase
LFCFFKIIGLKNASVFGNFLGRSIGPFFRSKNITKQNIKIALGALNVEKETEIINGMWSNIGSTFAEYIFLKDFRFNRTGFDYIKINGTNYL